MRKPAIVGLLTAGIAGAGIALPGPAVNLRGESGPIEIRTTSDAPASVPAVARVEEGPLRIMSLNLAHGRGRGAHQVLASTPKIKSTIEKAAESVQSLGIHALAIQEADGPSIWSGDFDHVDHLAKQSGLASFAHGEHASGLGLRYGTAILADRPLMDAHSKAFEARGPLAPKGFTHATMMHNGCPIELASIHLDFASAKRRRQEAEMIVETLSHLKRPIVVMGDLNSEWGKDDAVDHLIRELDLHAHRPQDPSLLTFPRMKRRLDWILASPELRFVDYQSPALDEISDHRPVVAELRLSDSQGCTH